jgi:hypothetical protein
MSMNEIDITQEQALSVVGFSFERGGAHSSRTIMLDELSRLFDFVDKVDAPKSLYFQAIVEGNCLAKRSRMTRMLTYKHLVGLYALDSRVILFRVMRFFWQRDRDARALLALLCAFARDSILRISAQYIVDTREGTRITRELIEAIIDNFEPGRFSQVTLASVAKNINSSFTKTGHFTGKARKVRSRAHATVGSVAYALFLGYLCGSRGRELFETEFAKLLDCPYDRMLELTEEASRKGWIVCKRIGMVIEIVFSNLITKEELERLHEQN